MDLTIFPPLCLPKKNQAFTGNASVYGTIVVKFFIFLFLTGWGQRDWWVTEEWDQWENDDKLHEVEVINIIIVPGKN